MKKVLHPLPGLTGLILLILTSNFVHAQSGDPRLDDYFQRKDRPLEGAEHGFVPFY